MLHQAEIAQFRPSPFSPAITWPLRRRTCWALFLGGFVLCLFPAEWAVAGSGDEILKRASDGERKQAALRAQYYYREHVEVRDAGKNGAPGKVRLSRDYEIIYLEGGPYRKLVLVNGKPLKPQQAQQEEQQMQKTAAQRREERARSGPARSKSITVGEARLDDMLRLMENTLLREEEIRGRKAWVVQSDSRRDLVASTPRDARILCYRYVHWIDQEDGAVAQQEFEVIREGIDAKPGTKSRAVFAKQDGSPWFLRSLDGEFWTKGHWFQQHRYHDFKKFEAHSEIEFGKEPK